MQTRKYPRTLAEAFGPYETGPIHAPHQRPELLDDVIMAVSIIGIVVVLALVVGRVL